MHGTRVKQCHKNKTGRYIAGCPSIHYTTFRCTFALSVENTNYCLVYDVAIVNKDLNIFLKLLDEVMHLVFKNNLRTTLRSKSEKFKNIEARKNLGILIKRECTSIP